MKKRIVAFLFYSLLGLSGCSEKNPDKMILSGEIQGLKKGTLYLEKTKGGKLTTLDSVQVEDDGKFRLSSKEEGSEIHYISLDKHKDKTLPFFGENGNIQLRTTLDKFVLKARFSGSRNHALWDRYRQMISAFQNEKLLLIKADLEARRDQNQKKLDSVSEKSKQWLQKKIRYTANFALSNSTSEVAPFLAITELSNANIQLLDTLEKSMNPAVKKSVYGQKLTESLKQLKKEQP